MRRHNDDPADSRIRGLARIIHKNRDLRGWTGICEGSHVLAAWLDKLGAQGSFPRLVVMFSGAAAIKTAGRRAQP